MTPLELSLPRTPGSFLLWAEIVLAWVLTSYGPVRDPVGRQEVTALSGGQLRRWRRRVAARSIVGAGVVLFLVGPGLPGAVLSTVFLGLALLLPELRQQCTRRVREGRWWELRAEYELTVNAVLLAITAAVVGGRNLRPTWDAAALVPGSDERLAGMLLVVAAAVFLVRGGTHVVRGVLEKGDTFPAGTGSLESTLRHGLTIGNLERFLVFVFVFLNSFAAVGFVLAAKGLVRAVDWEGRESVEYFLVGTFASMSLALVVGLLVRAAL